MTLRKTFQNISPKIPILLVGIFALGMIFFSNHFLISKNKYERRLIGPPAGLEHFSFGFREVIADSLWVRAIQDFDYCDQQIARKICHNNSWLFHMLDAITDLSPHFRMPYATGALALTVIITDVDGATHIFDKGVKEFPNDWAINYRAAYHYLYEVKDNKRAADLLIQAGKHGAPPWVFSLANRLYVDSGNTELAENLIQDMIQTEQDPQLIERMKQKLESLKKTPQ